MSDLDGQTLGHYRIIEQIGAGGMGLVYRARDERLDRDVAIKVLPESVAQDPDRLERFEREARAVARLEHPNILAIYDFGTEEGVAYAVTELLDGENLRERIPAGGVDWKKAAEIGAALADGLAAAHGKGIIHRDLKPENIFLTSDGRIKILDFGLAQVASPVHDEAQTATLTPAGTIPGTVIGTVGYMSPEQLKGRSVDARSDLFSFGCVMYEMLSGQRAFSRDSSVETMAAILNEEPPLLSGIGVAVPAELERTVRRCLEKRPEARFQSASDLAFNLRSISTDAEIRAVRPSRAEARPRGRPVLWRVAAPVILVAGAVAGWLWFSVDEGESPPPVATLLTTDSVNEFDPTLSPDGSMLAYSREVDGGGFELFVRLIGGGEPLLLDSGSLDFYVPCWSPDSLQVAYSRCDEDDDGRRACTVNSIPALGGASRLITPLTADSAGGISWSTDGKTLALVDRDSAGEPLAVFLLLLETGERRRITFPESRSEGDVIPKYSSDGQNIAFIRRFSTWMHDICVVAVNGGEPRVLTQRKDLIRGLDWTADGRRVVYSSSQPGRSGYFNLWEVAASGGTPKPLVFGDNAIEPSLSRQGGRLSFVRFTTATAGIWRAGGPAANDQDRTPRQFITSTGFDNYPQYSPDGLTIAFTSFRTGNSEIWLCDADGSNPRRLTFFEEAGVAGGGRWSPDGKQIAFLSDVEGTFDVWVIDADGGVPRRLTNLPSQEFVSNWSRDGKWIYFCSNHTGRWEVHKVPAKGGDPVHVTANGGAGAAESKDGRFLYYTKAHFTDGPRGIWRMPLGGGDEVRVHDRGTCVMWELFDEGICYLDLDRDPAVVEYVDFGTGEVSLIATTDYATHIGFAASPDLRRVLYQRIEVSQDIVLVENFR